jgi:hypothetical protein
MMKNRICYIFTLAMIFNGCAAKVIGYSSLINISRIVNEMDKSTKITLIAGTGRFSFTLQPHTTHVLEKAMNASHITSIDIEMDSTTKSIDYKKILSDFKDANKKSSSTLNAQLKITSPTTVALKKIVMQTL